MASPGREKMVSHLLGNDKKNKVVASLLRFLKTTGRRRERRGKKEGARTGAEE